MEGWVRSVGWLTADTLSRKWSSVQWRRHFFAWGGQRGAKTFLGGQVYMVANYAIPQYGTLLHYSKFPSLESPWSLFSLCFLWFLSFPPLFHSHLPSFPSFDTARGLEERCKLPSRSGRSPAAKWNLVNSGPRNELFLTCQSGKLQCSLNSLIDLYVLIQWQYELFWSVHKCDIH